MIACDHCVHGKATREEQFDCSHPLFKKRGRVIYRETFRILKIVGCGSGMKKE